MTKTKPAGTTKHRDAEIARIGREILPLETLETRHSDGLDFHNIAVWTMKAALEAAYEAGRLSAERSAR